MAGCCLRCTGNRLVPVRAGGSGQLGDIARTTIGRTVGHQHLRMERDGRPERTLGIGQLFALGTACDAELLEEAHAINAHPFTEDAVTREGAYLHRPDRHPVAGGSPTLPTTGVGARMICTATSLSVATTRCTSTRRSGKDSCHRLTCRHFAVPRAGVCIAGVVQLVGLIVESLAPCRVEETTDLGLPGSVLGRPRSSRSLCAVGRGSPDLMPRSTWRPTKPAVYPLTAVESVHASGTPVHYRREALPQPNVLSGRCAQCQFSLCQNRNHIHIVQTKVGILSPSRESPDSTGVSDIAEDVLIQLGAGRPKAARSVPPDTVR